VVVGLLPPNGVGALLLFPSEVGVGFINENKMTLAFIGGLLTIVTTGMGATWMLSSKFTDMQNQLDTVNEDRYTLTQASERALRTAIANPGMNVPDPRNPSNIIVVQVNSERNSNEH